MHYDFKFRSRRSNIMATHGIAASSQPLATSTGLEILRAGGNAADAAVAMAAVLNVVEPFSTGIGGDCFALYWDAKEKRVLALNGSGPAAKAASIDAIKKDGYHEFPRFTGHAVSVPGTVAGWSALLERFGTIPLADLLKPAIRYAMEGYPVTEWIGTGWKSMAKLLLRTAVDENTPNFMQRSGPPQPSGNEFLIDGRAPQIGEMITLPELGQTLKAIAEDGPQYFYEGDFANRLCKYVQQYRGCLETEDLSAFKPEWANPIYADYHGVRLFECPPNGQGLAAIMAAKIADGFDLAAMDQIDRTHTLIECMRLGFTEALQWVSDPHFNEIPYDNLFSESYIQSRQAMINSEKVLHHLVSEANRIGDDTVYLSVIDGEENACSFINSLYWPWGSGLIVPGTGVVLQNRAALFSLDPSHPNALVGGKRPYNTIIPGMITQKGELLASFGIMGGYMQPQAHLQILSNMVDCQMNPQQALDVPRFCLNLNEGLGVGAADPGGEVLLEPGYTFEDLAALRAKGHRIHPVIGYKRFIFGGGQIIQRNNETGVLIAGSDPRKDGCAMGW